MEVGVEEGGPVAWSKERFEGERIEVLRLTSYEIGRVKTFRYPVEVRKMLFGARGRGVRGVRGVREVRDVSE